MPKLIRRKTTIVRGRSAKSWNSWFGRLSSGQQQFLKTYFFHLVFLFFLANYVVVRQLQLTFFAQSCMSREMVTADNRCLYIYGGQVYEKGTRSKPHKNQRCGTDVTSIIPSFHTSNMAKYMDPNLVGTICSGQPPTATATPTSRPTNTPAPQATATRVPTQPPAAPTTTTRPNAPTITSLPTTIKPTNPTATNRTVPTATPRVITQSNPTATRIPTQKPQPTSVSGNMVSNQIITLTPTVNREQITNNRSGFGRFLADSEISNNTEKIIENGDLAEIDRSESTDKNQELGIKNQEFITKLVQLSQVAVGASFALMVITTLAVGIKKLNKRFTR